jgi:hypothetical protein
MKHTYKHTKPRPSWLLQGLMIRAGLYDPLPVTHRIQSSAQAVRQGNWLTRARGWVKGLFA